MVYFNVSDWTDEELVQIKKEINDRLNAEYNKELEAYYKARTEEGF